jgi:hypothetical protein
MAAVTGPGAGTGTAGILDRIKGAASGAASKVETGLTGLHNQGEGILNENLNKGKGFFSELKVKASNIAEVAKGSTEPGPISEPTPPQGGRRRRTRKSKKSKKSSYKKSRKSKSKKSRKSKRFTRRMRK